MKIFIHILTLTILFLALKPGIDSFASHSEVGCCAHTCEMNVQKNDCSPTENKDDNHNCDDHNCNPFQVCGCCKLFVNPILFPISEFETENFDDNGFALRSLFYPQYNADFWHPPQIV
jgi:hypothetical protein